MCTWIILTVCTFHDLTPKSTMILPENSLWWFHYLAFDEPLTSLGKCSQRVWSRRTIGWSRSSPLSLPSSIVDKSQWRAQSSILFFFRFCLLSSLNLVRLMLTSKSNLSQWKKCLRVGTMTECTDVEAAVVSRSSGFQSHAFRALHRQTGDTVFPSICRWNELQHWY